MYCSFTSTLVPGRTHGHRLIVISKNRHSSLEECRFLSMDYKKDIFAVCSMDLNLRIFTHGLKL